MGYVRGKGLPGEDRVCGRGRSELVTRDYNCQVCRKEVRLRHRARSKRPMKGAFRDRWVGETGNRGRGMGDGASGPRGG